MTQQRKERVLWLGYHLALPGKWLTYDKQSKQFGVTPEFQKEYSIHDASEDSTLSVKDTSVSRSSATCTTATADQGTEGLITEKDKCGNTQAIDNGPSMITEETRC
jgi:hypothetical protein